MSITTFICPDDELLINAARQANAEHLHLVINRDGQVVLSPILLPGMQKIAVRDKQHQEAA